MYRCIEISLYFPVTRNSKIRKSCYDTMRMSGLPECLQNDYRNTQTYQDGQRAVSQPPPPQIRMRFVFPVTLRDLLLG